MNKEDSEIADNQKITNAAAKKVDAHNFVEIEFEKGQAVLSESARTSVRSVYEQATQDGKVKKIYLISWADEEFPSKELKALSSSQKELANKRNENLESYVNELRLPGVEVQTFSMATQPNFLAKLFNTTDQKLKTSLVAAGLPTTANDPQYPSKASHSVVLIQLK
jgi:hypothetical protein